MNILMVLTSYLLIINHIGCVASALNSHLPIGIIFDEKTSDETRNLVDQAISLINNNNKLYGPNRWRVLINIIDMNNMSELMNTICSLMSRGVLAVFGPINAPAIDTIESFTDFYHLPYISWSYYDKKEHKRQGSDSITVKNEAFKNGNIQTLDASYIIQENRPSQIYTRPDLMPALIELVNYHKWSKIVYVFNHHQGLDNLEKLLKVKGQQETHLEEIISYKLQPIVEQNDQENVNLKILRSIDDREESEIVVVIDLDTIQSYQLLLRQLKAVGMVKSRFIYVLATLDIHLLDVNGFRLGGAQVYGMSLMDYKNPLTAKLLNELTQFGEPLKRLDHIPSDAALLVDALFYFTKKINSMIGSNENALFELNQVSIKDSEIYINGTRGIPCSLGSMTESNRWPFGNFIVDNLKTSRLNRDGFTGTFNFDSTGRRVRTNIYLYKVELNKPLFKIGDYSSDRGLKITYQTSSSVKQEKPTKLKISLGVPEEPFVMIKPNENRENLNTNEIFYGYSVDLAKHIAQRLNLSYELSLSKDGKYGYMDENGVWNGIMGELIRNEIDMSLAPLTITTKREQYIDFSIPFMSNMLSVLLRKPRNNEPGMLSLLAPFDWLTWTIIVIAYICASLALYVSNRFSPWETRPRQNIGNNSSSQRFTATNDFTLLNAFWFNMASFMQQRIYMTPKSISGRLITTLWWTFSILILIYYSFTLYSSLTSDSQSERLQSLQELAAQTKIRYGTVKNRTVHEFFKINKQQPFKDMLENMETWNDDVMTSSNLEGIEKIRSSKRNYAFLQGTVSIDYVVNKYPCDMYKIATNIQLHEYGAAFSQNSKLKDSVNMIILKLNEEGILDELKNKWWQDKSEFCTFESSSIRKMISLKDLMGVFYMLLIGVLLSILVAIVELVYYSKVQSKRKNTSVLNAISSRVRLSIGGYD